MSENTDDGAVRKISERELLLFYEAQLWSLQNETQLDALASKRAAADFDSAHKTR